LASAQNLTLRIVTYNIENDITNKTFPNLTGATPLPGLISPYYGGGSTKTVANGGVMEGIEEEILSDGVVQPVDIFALEETSGPSTIKPILAGLNAYYGQFNPLASNRYASSPYQATESGGTTNDGNGPNALVYNTQTVQILASVPVDPVGGTASLGSSSGEYREVMRYEFAPAGQIPTPATEFYIYVSHYKSGTTSTDANDRAKEAAIIRTNETSLPANARVIYVGDYNVDTSAEAGYQTIVAAAAPNGITQGQGVDPLNITNSTTINWESSNSNPAILIMLTEEAYDLRYRDDLQLSTSNIFFDVAGGLCLATNTYHAFGNNSSLPYGSTVINSANTALNNLAPGSPIGRLQLLTNLTGASDHLPVVADYTIPINQPEANFAVTPTAGAVAPLSVMFTDASTGIVTNWFWNFGDGSTSNTFTTTNVTHIYTVPGTYSVIETVTGPGGTHSVTQTSVVTVLTSYQAWQLVYFGCTNCPQAQTNADADGTGQDNLFKFVAGLNPINSSSVFVFNTAAVPGQPTEENLIFGPIESGSIYTALYATNLASPIWMPLTTTLSNAVGSELIITDTNATQPQKFYEIEISGP
jgi:PKD repeat protein